MMSFSANALTNALSLQADIERVKMEIERNELRRQQVELLLQDKEMKARLADMEARLAAVTAQDQVLMDTQSQALAVAQPVVAAIEGPTADQTAAVGPAMRRAWTGYPCQKEGCTGRTNGGNLCHDCNFERKCVEQERIECTGCGHKTIPKYMDLTTRKCSRCRTPPAPVPTLGSAPESKEANKSCAQCKKTTNGDHPFCARCWFSSQGKEMCACEHWEDAKTIRMNSGKCTKCAAKSARRKAYEAKIEGLIAKGYVQCNDCQRYMKYVLDTGNCASCDYLKRPRCQNPECPDPVQEHGWDRPFCRPCYKTILASTRYLDQGSGLSAPEEDFPPLPKSWADQCEDEQDSELESATMTDQEFAEASQLIRQG
jgi:hypothetical protein